MKKYKKKNNYLKFLLSALAISAISLPISFVLSSCSVTVNDKKNTIIISSSSSESQEVTDDQLVTLYVQASYNGKELSYQWYKASDSEGTSWNSITGATSNSYTVPSTDLSSSVDSVLMYKVEISYTDDSSTVSTSKIFTLSVSDDDETENKVEITTNLSTSTSFTSGTETTFNVSASTNVTGATLYYDWYLDKGTGTYSKVQSSDSNSYTISASDTSSITTSTKWKLYVNVYVSGNTSIQTQSNVCEITITPKSSNNTNETIYARSTNSSGLTTVTYDQEKWLGDNEVSIAMVATPNISYLQTFVSNYLSKNSSSGSSDASNAYTMMNNLSSALSSNNYSTSSTVAGTGWILDYSEDSSTSNLINYYLATNIHVLESTYSIAYRTSLTVDGHNTIATVTVSVPINTETVSDLSVYLSQPQYSTSSSSSNLKVPFGSSYDTAWHKTPITIDTLSDSLIPLGSYTSDGNPSLSTAYAVQISYAYNNMLGVSEELNYYFPSDASIGSYKVNAATQNTRDFSVIKISEDKSAFDDLGTDSTWTTMFQKMQTMFNVDTNDSKATKSSSYIARLNALINLAKSSSYSKEAAEELFMFADYNKDLTSSTVISVAGFPGTTSGNSSYINFNSNTISYSLAETPSSSVEESREEIAYNYQGKLYYSSYSWSRDILLPNVDLMSGSSGSMNVTQDYKIVGIYWGVLTSGSNEYGISTEIYSYSDDASMIKIWLKYIKQKDSNSKLLALFTALSNKSYFS